MSLKLIAKPECHECYMRIVFWNFSSCAAKRWLVSVLQGGFTKLCRGACFQRDQFLWLRHISVHEFKCEMLKCSLMHFMASRLWCVKKRRVCTCSWCSWRIQSSPSSPWSHAFFFWFFFGFRFSKAMLRLKSGNPRGCNLVRRKNATLTELLQMLLCK